MENSYSNILRTKVRLVVCTIRNWSLNLKKSTLYYHTYNNIHFSPNKCVIARTFRKHTMTVFDLGTVKKFPIFHPFPISAMTKENLYLFFSFCQAFFSIHTKYSWEYWDTCVIYDHIFLSSIHHTAQKSTQIKAISEIFPTVRPKSYFYCLSDLYSNYN